MNEVTLQMESNAKAPGLSRSRLAAMRSKLEPRFDDVVLVVSELVSNSVRHGSSNGIDVKVTAGEETIRVEVADDGPGFATDVARGEGLGLTIVEKLSERWGLEEGRSKFTVWAELSTAHPGNGPAS
jgi:anti-sigma regulatory factor (Ser/Thr protein kinase)